MAEISDCQAPLSELAERRAAVDPKHKEKKIPDRTLSLHRMDHDVLFAGRLHQGELVDLRLASPHEPPANIRLSMTSDDLIALTERRLNFAHAWATGRVRLDASLRDLLRLRKLA